MLFKKKKKSPYVRRSPSCWKIFLKVVKYILQLCIYAIICKFYNFAYMRLFHSFHTCGWYLNVRLNGTLFCGWHMFPWWLNVVCYETMQKCKRFSFRPCWKVAQMARNCTDTITGTKTGPEAAAWLWFVRYFHLLISFCVAIILTQTTTSWLQANCKTRRIFSFGVPNFKQKQKHILGSELKEKKCQLI